jgi:hypothetical protein
MSAATLERGGVTGSAAPEVTLAALRDLILLFDAKRFRRQALVEQGFGPGLKQASIAYSRDSVSSRSRKRDFPDSSDTSIRHSGVSLK